MYGFKVDSSGQLKRMSREWCLLYFVNLNRYSPDGWQETKLWFCEFL